LREGRLAVDYQNHTDFNVDGRPLRDQLDPHHKEGETKQSWREYMEDSAYEIVIEVLPSGPFSTEDIVAAFYAPKFHLYYGRKVCMPSIPIRPTIVEGDSPLDVFRLPLPDEFVGFTEKRIQRRYQNGLTMALDMEVCPTLSDKNKQDFFGGQATMATPQSFRDAVMLSVGRTFSRRTCWVVSAQREV
jgi:hypothetical protein